MQESTTTRRQCPTRPNGAEVLIEQRISGSTCQERQRKHYHKCYSCVHRNDLQQSGATAHVQVTLPPVDRTPLGEVEPLEKRTQTAAQAAGPKAAEASKADARQAV